MTNVCIWLCSQTGLITTGKLDADVPVIVEMHASDSRRVSVEGVDAAAGVRVPDLESSIRTTADNDIT
jgi:hypothetical protein